MARSARGLKTDNKLSDRPKDESHSLTIKHHWVSPKVDPTSTGALALMALNIIGGIVQNVSF